VTGRAGALRAALLVAAATTPVALAAPAARAGGSEPVPSHRLFSFADPDVFESSGLVDTGRLVVTTNDSGDTARLFGVDPDDGRTVAVTTYADDATDVEALAPGPGDTVWVGDIGDNRRNRPSVDLYEVPAPAGGERSVSAPRFRIAYPDGPRDAETLLVQPRSGRVFVVSKSVFGGTVYAAPSDLSASGVNRMRRFATVAGLVTDGAFFPDGRRVVLRGYGSASVYTFPDFGLVGTVRLPRQRQGEGVAVGPDGRVLLSSEGSHADVLQVDLPVSLTAGSAAGSPLGPTPATRRPGNAQRPAPAARDDHDWVAILLVGAGVAGLGWLTVRAGRSRS
jgi:hypothetical protein